MVREEAAENEKEVAEYTETHSDHKVKVTSQYQYNFLF
jgi:hypothetical protein